MIDSGPIPEENCVGELYIKAYEFSSNTMLNVRKIISHSLERYTRRKVRVPHCLGSLAWIKKSSLSRDHISDQNYAKPD